MVSFPPTVDSLWVDTIDKFGSGKLSVEQILMRAIELGEYGFPVSELSALYVSLLVPE